MPMRRGYTTIALNWETVEQINNLRVKKDKNHNAVIKRLIDTRTFDVLDGKIVYDTDANEEIILKRYDQMEEKENDKISKTLVEDVSNSQDDASSTEENQLDESRYEDSELRAVPDEIRKSEQSLGRFTMGDAQGETWSKLQ